MSLWFQFGLSGRMPEVDRMAGPSMAWQLDEVSLTTLPSAGGNEEDKFAE